MLPYIPDKVDIYIYIYIYIFTWCKHSRSTGTESSAQFGIHSTQRTFLHRRVAIMPENANSLTDEAVKRNRSDRYIYIYIYIMTSSTGISLRNKQHPCDTETYESTSDHIDISRLSYFIRYFHTLSWLKSYA
jgi:hypothetical protein